MKRFSEDLNDAMRAAGLTGAELAEQTGLTEAAISLLRSGRRSPALDTAQRLSKALPALAERLRDEIEASAVDSIESAIADV
ncbi:MAG: helix-turn-helix transcriptional regulator, partial [Candidatus Eremiobacteraeota bacterium]|nr:helix-turn-helix transcriptional regulator [Candidatus Eremiobacteraeota bacterium]